VISSRGRIEAVGNSYQREITPRALLSSGWHFVSIIKVLVKSSRSAKSDICATSVQKRAIQASTKAVCH
jgi:hypothetical protein